MTPSPRKASDGGAPQASPIIPDIWQWEGRLGRELIAWSVTSIAAGAVLSTRGARANSPALVAFGTQNAGWGAVDLVLALAGQAARSRRRSQLDDPADPQVQQRQALKMRRLLAVNAGLDVGYIAAGKLLALLSLRQRRASQLPAGVGHGAAIIVQGTFLLVFDAWHAWQLSGRTQPGRASAPSAATG